MSRAVLQNITWETYKNLSDASDSALRLTYDRGCLEVEMSPHAAHEAPNRLVEVMLEIVTDSWNWDMISAGSMTCSVESLLRGGEPDSSFYFRNIPSLPADIALLNPEVNPPDLIVEIDISSPSIDKRTLYKAMRVPEIWRFSKTEFVIYCLVDDEYVIMASQIIPGMTAEQLTSIISEGRLRLRTEWRQTVRQWAKNHPP